MISKNRRNISSFLVDILTLTLFVLMFVSQLRLLAFYSYLCLGCVLAIFLVIMFDRRFIVKHSLVFVISLGYILLTLLIPLLFGQTQLLNRYISLSEVFIFFLVFKYNITLRGYKANMRLLIALLIIILYPTIFSLIALSENGSACRSIKSSFQPGDISFYYLMHGVLGYELIYSTMLMSISLMGLLLFGGKSIKKIYRFFILFYVVLFTILVVMSNYFTATILLFIGYLLVLVFKRGAKILLFLLPLLFIYTIDRNTINANLLNAALAVAPEGKTYNRIEQIRDNLGNTNNLEEVDSREETNETSLNQIIEHPLLGAIASDKFAISDVGQHSYVLDTMAIYGIPIGLLGCFAVLLPLIYLYRRVNVSMLKRFCFLFGLIYIFLLYRNNITITIGFSAYFFFPTIYSQLKEYQYEKNTHSRTII